MNSSGIGAAVQIFGLVQHCADGYNGHVRAEGQGDESQGFHDIRLKRSTADAPTRLKETEPKFHGWQGRFQ